MRRSLLVVPTAAATLALTALPALAAEGGSGEAGGDAAAGTMSGVLLAMILGIILGTIVTIGAYRGKFGGQQAHQAHAHDLREGVGGHDVTMDVDQETTPTGSA